MQIDVKEIAKVTLEPNEYLMIILPEKMNRDSASGFSDCLKEFFGDKSDRVAVLVGDIVLKKAVFKDEKSS